MTSSQFAGRVFLLAGDGPALAAIADALTASDAFVAVVGSAPVTAEPAAHFHADAADSQVWDRVVPHVEQRLGPIDGVLTEQAGHDIACRLVGPDLTRRGHGAVLLVGASDDAEQILRTLAGTL